MTKLYLLSMFPWIYLAAEIFLILPLGLYVGGKIMKLQHQRFTYWNCLWINLVAGLLAGFVVAQNNEKFYNSYVTNIFNQLNMKNMFKRIATSMLALTLLLSAIPANAQSTSFAERCQTYGFYGLDDWFHVQLQDMTGNVSDSCVADDWSVTMSSGETNVFGEVVKSSQEIKIKRKDGGGMNVRAKSGNEMTDDNYIMLVKANSSIGTLPPKAGYEDEVIVNMSSFENPFPDTNISSLEGLSASELYRRGVIGGYPDGEFKGYREVNRAEAAKLLLLARFGTVADIKNSGQFPDVKEGEWYVPFVVTAANKGIINGYPDGLFRPQNTVNTAEFLKMLTSTFGLSENLDYSYTDVKSGDWFAKYAGIAEKYNLFPNRNTYLNPGDNLTRNEVAIAIYQYLLNR